MAVLAHIIHYIKIKILHKKLTSFFEGADLGTKLKNGVVSCHHLGIFFQAGFGPRIPKIRRFGATFCGFLR